MRFPALLALAALAASPLFGRAEERVHGMVLDTRVTYCEAGKPSTCKGSLVLRRDPGEQPRTVTIDVPLGTPISRGCEAVPLHRLQGRPVIVTQSAAPHARVARAVESAEFPAGAC